MSANIRTRLADQGIFLRQYVPGERRAPCPRCLRGKQDDALAVKVDDRGACWACHRCGWRGAANERTDQPQRRHDAQFSAMMDKLRSAPEKPAALGPDLEALEMWAASGAIWGTLAETYLRRRGLILPDVNWSSQYPYEHLRFHRSCQMGDQGRFPALIVAINSPNGRLVGVQRIALTAHGRKAPIARAKMAKGPVKTCAARLADWRITDTLALTEGIEDALAYMRLTGTPTWAACGGGMIKSMVLPKQIANVVIVADADEAGIKAARVAYAEFKSQGRNVRVVRTIGAKDPAEIAGRAA